MLTLSLLVFGVLGYNRLGVDQFPEMEFPVVRVMATLEGASPEVMEEDVTDVLEEYLNTISGVRKLTLALHAGAVRRSSVEFDLGRISTPPPRTCATSVARAQFDLPDEMEPPIVDKVEHEWTSRSCGCR